MRLFFVYVLDCLSFAPTQIVASSNVNDLKSEYIGSYAYCSALGGIQAPNLRDRKQKSEEFFHRRLLNSTHEPDDIFINHHITHFDCASQIKSFK
jgi:hypothetical protein